MPKREYKKAEMFEWDPRNGIKGRQDAVGMEEVGKKGLSLWSTGKRKLSWSFQIRRDSCP